MDKSAILEKIKLAGDNPVMIFCDNVKLFYVNVKDWYLFEDGNFFVSVRKNTNGQEICSQKDCPWVVTYFIPDEVQFMQVYPKKTDIKTILESLTTRIGFDTDADAAKKEILSDPIMLSTFPRTYREDDKLDRQELVGGNLGSAVYLGKDIPKFEKDLIKAESSTQE